MLVPARLCLREAGERDAGNRLAGRDEERDPRVSHVRPLRPGSARLMCFRPASFC